MMIAEVNCESRSTNEGPEAQPPKDIYFPPEFSVEIKATVLDDYDAPMWVCLEEATSKLRHPCREGKCQAPANHDLGHPYSEEVGRRVTWRFSGVPPAFVPSIEVVSFTPEVNRDGQSPLFTEDGHGPVFSRPFRSFYWESEGGVEKLVGIPYYSTGGYCRYEVVLVPKSHSGKQKIRLYCTTQEMGGLEIDGPPA